MPCHHAFGLSVHAFCGTGDENIIPTCREAGNYYITCICAGCFVYFVVNKRSYFSVSGPGPR